MTKTESQPAAAKPNRRWYQYSLRTLLLLPLILAMALSAAYSWPIVQRRYILWRLQDYAGKDLRMLPDEDKDRICGWVAAFAHC
jgi:hypothetical protein